jgi:hypothetical protein
MVSPLCESSDGYSATTAGETSSNIPARNRRTGARQRGSESVEQGQLFAQTPKQPC